MIKYNNINIENINYNNTNITLVNYNGNVIWAKPYTLAINNSSGYTNYTIIRESSKEPTAATGGSIAAGSKVYYGDVLKITGNNISTENKSTWLNVTTGTIAQTNPSTGLSEYIGTGYMYIDLNAKNISVSTGSYTYEEDTGKITCRVTHPKSNTTVKVTINYTVEAITSEEKTITINSGSITI